ncbi:fimbrin [Batrachochytrium dendrobatidis]
MSGFRDFSSDSLAAQVKTLSSSLDEDDWDTEPNTANTIHSNPGPTLPSSQHEPIQSSNDSWREQSGHDWLQTRKSVTSTVRPMAATPIIQSSAYLVSSSTHTTTLKQSMPSLVTSGGYGTPQFPVLKRSQTAFVKPTPSSVKPVGPVGSVKPVESTKQPVLNAAQMAAAASWRDEKEEDWLSQRRSTTNSGRLSINQTPLQYKPQQLSQPHSFAAPLPSVIPAVALSHKHLPTADSILIPTQYAHSNMGINTTALAAKFPFFTPSEIAAFHQQFAAVDKDNQDRVHTSDLSAISTKTGESFQAVTAKLTQLSLTDKDGLVSFDGFLKAVSKVREEKGGTTERDDKKIVLHGHMENTTHTINVDEKESFTVHINQQLANDKDVKSRLPIDPRSMQVFSECKDGLILAKLINDSQSGTIDERVLNVGKKLNTFQMTENNNVVVNSAKAIGCSVVNIGSQDIMEGREHLILGLIWQIIKIGLQAFIDIKVHPELFRLLENGELLEDFLKLPAEQILLRWFNYHLKKAGHARKVNNFTSDVKDGENYTVLLNQLAPECCSRSPLQTPDLLQRAEQILVNADKIGCRKYLTAKTMVEGNQKLNFAFVAHLFNTRPGLEKLTEAEMAQLDDWLFKSEGDREARAFALWLNSLGVEPFVNNLFDDLCDGLVLLQAMDKVHPGLVDWKKVNRPAPVASKFKKVENTNYVVVLGKSLKFSLVGIQGSDIVDGNKTLTLGLVWQLMREHVVQTLKSLSKAGHDITDSDIVKWANDAVKASGKSSTMSSFKDPSLHNGIFLLDLLQAIKKGIVNSELVTNGATDESAKMNAKYAISIARKLGATIFVLPEDIVEVKSKMIMTFVGTIMALAKSGVLN